MSRNTGNQPTSFYKSLLVFGLLAGLASGPMALAAPEAQERGPQAAFSLDEMAAGAAAKLACSGVFVMGRTEADVIARDLRPFEYPLLTKTEFEFDKDLKTASAISGTAKRTALYRPGLGCTLMVDTDRDTLLAQSADIEVKPVHYTNEPWPAGDQVVISQKDPAIDWVQLDQAVSDAFTDTTEGQTLDTRAVLVVYDGKIVAEKYADGFDSNSRFLAWSASKSVTSALIGTMVTDGQLALDAPAPVATWSNPDDPRHAITLHHLLNMASGLEFSEPYTLGHDSTTMLFNKADMGGYAADKPLEHAPNTKWYYSSGTTNLLAKILSEKAGGSVKALYDYSWEQFFGPVGMHSAIFEPDVSGSYVGSSYFYATARDWARFGLLYLNEGRVGGQQILSKEWVEATKTPTPLAPRHQYGMQFWNNGGTPMPAEGRMFPDLPADTFMALGHNTQSIAMIPSRKAVIIRFGWTTGKEPYGMNSRFAAILKALPAASNAE
ncbi:serine hydrolase domain-containing protein [Kordiimonas pumila]|uniref:Serine hydrolase domain-containing protein n=1 Tax=Kordiimonas pumila TaxID=2161677 RepID=A0ABV7D0E6_9PROT|nr:serine hydrolase [Kordiimonas pumila]